MTRTLFSRSGRLALAALMFLCTLVPLVAQHKASAYGQIASRSIKMSSSVAGATGVTYDVKFNVATNSTVKSLVVDFCANSPILGDSCTGTVGTDVPDLTASPTITYTSGITATYTASTLNSQRTLTLTKAAGDVVNAPNPIEFQITNVTNPSAIGTFYARIYTFPNDTTSNYAGGYTPTTLGSNIPTDAGGVALSTAAQINVTSKVQERLTFCVYTTGSGNDCTSKSGTAVTLGDTNGVLDPAGPYVDVNAKYSVTTNATGDAIIRMKGTLPTSGANDIDTIGTTATASSAGSEQFGMCTYQSAGTGMTPTAPYADTNCSTTSQTAGTGSTGGIGSPASTFAFNTPGTTSTYGDPIATKPAGSFSTGTLAFVGNVSNTTPAGIYTTALTFIATGTY